jgi:hypothetical protein
VGFVTGERLSPSAERGLVHLWVYAKHHGTARVPRDYRTASGHRLGEWVARRRKYRGQNVTLDQLLESLPGWTWAPHEQSFAEQLERYKEATAADRLARSHTLTIWVAHQRHAAREGALSADRLKGLREAGIL